MKFILPLFIIFTIAIRPVLPIVNYAINYQSIVKNDCVNRMKPQKGCNGKCFLEKELAKTEKQSEKTLVKINSIDIFITNEILVCSLLSSNHFVENIKFSDIQNQHLSTYNADIFHPPLV